MRDAGYDGVIQYDKAGNVSIAVTFDSNQIKSATENIGTFDGENPDIRYSINDRGTDYDDRGERWDGTMMEIGKDQTEREAEEYLYTLYEFDEGTKIRYLAYDCKTNRLFASSPETSQVYCLIVKNKKF